MNLHPLIVHFPIAILTIYSISEFITHKKLLKTDFWFYFKAILVILGVIFSIIAVITAGNINSNLNESYNFWLNKTTIVFGIIALAYSIVWIDKLEKLSFNYGTLIEKFWRLITKLSRLILRKRWIIIILAIIGFILLLITEALSELIVYGNINPLTFIVNKILVKG